MPSFQLTPPVMKSSPQLLNSVRSLCPSLPNKVTNMWSHVPAFFKLPVVTSTLYSAMLLQSKLQMERAEICCYLCSVSSLPHKSFTHESKVLSSFHMGVIVVIKKAEFWEGGVCAMRLISTVGETCCPEVNWSEPKHTQVGSWHLLLTSYFLFELFLQLWPHVKPV